MEELRPSEYFDYIKSKKQQVTDETLQKLYENSLVLLNKYNITGQTSAMKKLIFQLETIEKERQLVKMGINTFVYKDDIDTYIDDVSKNTVKVIELSRYEREIPDEIVLAVEKTKDIFDQFYVVFTDYTGKVERQVEQERRENDPILFGSFQDSTARTIVDRFYFLGDWVDEYCDLTLDKMVSEMKASTGSNIQMTISTPEDIQALKLQLKRLEPKNNSYIISQKQPKKSFFEKVRSVFGHEA